MKQYGRGLDVASKRRLHQLLGKFVNAVQICLIKGSLHQDRVRFFMSVNDKAKTRRLTKSDILAKGEGMVISYGVLVAKRTAKTAFTQAQALEKGKRGEKRKSSAKEDIDEPSTWTVLEHI